MSAGLDGDLPVSSGSQLDQRAQERMMSRNESASTNDSRTAVDELAAQSQARPCGGEAH